MLSKRHYRKSKLRTKRFRRHGAGMLMGLALTFGGVHPDALKALQQTVQGEVMDPEKRVDESGDGHRLGIHLPKDFQSH
ncbi:hypothetical protein [Alicyclobacillus sp. SO9]|uniref:hypothetical protein n=1 Tax=Alicyclobacillus sp. SO9 TaxID=2665646 RepID=UPI0018E70896|nr:hypothetical protein [Alicyclobacillus sp. SO9]QQE81028.1 hypothetical protein GI364_11985 [Alicyclobacillus sp. SO9]